MQKVALKIVFLLVLTSCFFRAGLAQVYPVQLSTQLIPPYSSYLPDYGDPTNEKLKCILVLQDFSVTHRDVKLEITITGNGYTIKTKSSFVPSPITLLPGTPQLITSVDLAPYLQTQNLDFTGINAADYELRRILPEGYYSICIRAVDYYNVNYTQVSNESCNSAWFFLNDPPFLNFPSCEAEIDPVTPQLIIFQWTAMNLNSPNSVLGTEYDFELFELRPNNGIPNNIVQNSAPVFSITTTQPFFQYSITEPTLYLGMNYVWRVRARDLSGRDLFKNDGWSQICTFTYGNINSAFSNDAFSLVLNAQSSTHRQGKLWWNHISNFTQYKVQVRKSGTENWFDYFSTVAEMKVNELEPSITYEARVMGIGNSVQSDWSNTASFITQPVPVFNCNDQTQPINALSANPLLAATPFMIFQIGQFEMEATSISADAGAPGYFSGQGRVRMYGLKIGVEYNHVYINDNLEITSGNVVALTEGIDAWLDDWMLDQAMDDAIFIDENISEIYVQDSVIYVITADGDTLTFEFPGMNHPVVINDSDGSSYLVNPDGTVTILPSWMQFSNDFLDATEEMKITFSKSVEQVYGFDEYQVMQWAEDYEIILCPDSSKYFVPYKSIKSGATDFVMAEFSNTEISLSEFSFSTAGGQTLTSEIIGNKIKIRLENLTEDVGIYAKAGNLKMGKLNVKVYEEEEKQVVIVPLGNLSAGDITSITNTINQTFSQAVYKWNVSLGNSYTATNWDDNNNGKVDIDDYSLLNKYSDEMDKIRNGFDDSNIDKDAFILFIVSGFGDVTVDGYMPYGRRYGFIKAGSNAKTFAHELGHGAFGLQHTFPDIAQSSTDNLLDYGNGNHLARWQWDWMREGHWLENIIAQQSPYIISEEEYEKTGTGELEPILNVPNPSGIYTPSGKFISTTFAPFDFSDVRYDFISGGLYSFTYQGNAYVSLFCKNQDGRNIFCAYVKDGFYQRLKEYSHSNLMASGVSESYIATLKVSYDEMIQYLKLHQNEVFTEFKWTSSNSHVIGNYFNIYGSVESRKCNSSIVQWVIKESQITTSDLKGFNQEGIYEPPLWGEIDVLTLEDIPLKPDGNLDAYYRTIGVSNGGTTFDPNEEIASWYCRLVSIYEEGGWGKFTLEKRMNSEGINYSEFKNLYTSNNSSIQQNIIIAEVYEQLGKDFLAKCANKVTNEETWRLLHELMTTSMEYDLAFATTDLEKEFIKQTLLGRIERFENGLNALQVTNEAEVVCMVVEKMQSQEVFLLDVPTRIRALAILSNTQMRGSVNLFGKDEEGNALKLMEYLKPEFFSEFLIALKSTKVGNNSLLFNLDYELNDAELVSGDGNYGRYYKLLINQIFEVYGKGRSADQLFNSTSRGSIIYLGTGSGCYYHSKSTSISGGGSVINLEYKKNCDLAGQFDTFLSQWTAAINDDTEKWFEINGSFETQNFTYDPFQDWVMVIPYSDNDALGLEKNKPILLPAIGVHFLTSEKSNQNSRLFFRTVVNLVSIAAGGAGLASQGLTKALAIMDLAGTGVDLSMDIFDNELKNLLGVEVYNDIRMGAGLLQLGSLGGMGLIGTSKIINNLPKLTNKISGLTIDVDALSDIAKAKVGRVVEFFGGSSQSNNIIRGITKEEFINSVRDFKDGTKSDFIEESWTLFREFKKDELLTLFRNQRINYDEILDDVWPPAYGFQEITEIKNGSQLNEKIFDRFQSEIDLKGSYASPVNPDDVYTLSSRALGVNYDDLDELGQIQYYFKFKIINPPNELNFKFGKAFPWFDDMGGAMQIKSSARFQDLASNIQILEKWKYNNGQWIRIE